MFSFENDGTILEKSRAGSVLTRAALVWRKSARRADPHTLRMICDAERVPDGGRMCKRTRRNPAPAGTSSRITSGGGLARREGSAGGGRTRLDAEEDECSRRRDTLRHRGPVVVSSTFEQRGWWTLKGRKKEGDHALESSPAARAEIAFTHVLLSSVLRGGWDCKQEAGECTRTRN